MKGTVHWTARDPAERPEQSALIYIERLFTAFCLGYGAMMAFAPPNRVPANAVSDFAQSIGISSSGALSAVFLLPGAFLICPPSRTAGLWMAIFGIGVFEVGLAASALNGTGTATAPVAMAFPLAVAAVLLSVRRHPGSSSAGRSSDGTVR